MRPTTAHTIAARCGGRLVGDSDVFVERVTTDSRAGVREGDLFVGLVGEKFHGGHFAGEALDAGASVALVEEGTEIALPPGRACVFVADPLRALHQLAAAARGEFGGTVVAITGTNGKTTTKDLLVAAVGSAVRVAASPMSYNSQIGVPLSLLGIDSDADVAVIECGISQPGEMERLAAMVRPDAGIFVNVGDAHIAGLGSRDTTAREKSLLFSAVAEDAWVLVPAAETLAATALSALGAPIETVDATTALVGMSLPELPSSGFVACAALAVSAARRLGVGDAAIEIGLATWRPAPMRLETSMTPRGVVLINDAYTADPGSMEAALDALCRETRTGAVIAVLAGMAQLGERSAAAHAAVGRRVVERDVDRLVAVGAGGAEIAAAAVMAGMPESRVHRVAEVAEAAAVLEEHTRAGDVVLLKGSRPERLERIAEVLFEAVAPARLYVDLDRIVANLRRVRTAVGAGCGVMPVVKSFGYGLDSVRLAVELEKAGVEYFAVAYPDEGVVLRERGITTPILVQNVVPSDVDKVARHGLTAQVSTTEQIDHLAREGQRQQRVVRCHVKVDTGMGRAGTDGASVERAADRVAAEPWLEFEGLMTHFAASEDAGQDAFTRSQISAFSDAVARLAAAGHHPRWVHACNSVAVARFPEAHHSLVRVGLGLLGFARFAGEPVLGQEPVVHLTTRVVSTKTIPAGGTVGYGRTWVAPRDTRVAVVAIGYSDGYPLALSNRGWMSIRGVRCPVVGRVCMDVTMLDVSGLADVTAGDEVVVFGDGEGEPDLCAHAEAADTIAYELLTRISDRVRRIYRRSH